MKKNQVVRSRDKNKITNLEAIPFNINTNDIVITRITDLRSIIEFIEKNKLHFSPLSLFKDHTEGKKFIQAKLQESQKGDKVNIPSSFRRKIMYASCWYQGDETLHMWDIYGKSDKLFAIQFNLDEFLKLGFLSKNFYFTSSLLDEYTSRGKNNHEFKPNSLHYGAVEYIDLKSKIENDKYYIGRFKDIAFKHENELRFLLRQNYKDAPLVNLNDLKCHFTASDFKKLQIKIKVSPYADDLYIKGIENAFNRYKNIKIMKSDFSDLFK